MDPILDTAGPTPTTTPTTTPRHRLAPRHHRATSRTATTRSYLMAAPDHLEVAYAINPWMDPTAPFDPERAMAQWTALRETYRALGHSVQTLPAVAGLPDLVFSANGALVVDGRAFLSRYRHPERSGEEAVHRAWLDAQGIASEQSVEPCEGEGDLLVVGSTILAGAGFRTTTAAHAQLRAWSGLEVVGLELVNERFYHLDTALGVVSDTVVAWYPPALSLAAADEVLRRYPDAIEVDEHDASLLGCNLVSDGRNVVIPAGCDHLAADLVAAGFSPIHVDTSELLLAGGGPKCMTAEQHRVRTA